MYITQILCGGSAIADYFHPLFKCNKNKNKVHNIHSYIQCQPPEVTEVYKKKYSHKRKILPTHTHGEYMYRRNGIDRTRNEMTLNCL